MSSFWRGFIGFYASEKFGGFVALILKGGLDGEQG
jgi:hypothetical protein